MRLRAALLTCLLSPAGLLMAQSSDRAGSASPPPALRDVLNRAAQYAVDYGYALSTVLAQEDYTQQALWPERTDDNRSRRLVSEIAFLRLVDSTEWLTFRNVLSVDGEPIPDSAGRLDRLFRNPPQTLVAQARIIASESARYNLGPIAREISVPTIALHFVHPRHQASCRFDKDGEETVDGERALIVRFRESEPGRLISRNDGKKLRAEGRLWLVPEGGRVVRSELVVKDLVRGDRGSKAQVNVTWHPNEALGLSLPSEMRDRYEGAVTIDGRRSRFVVSGVATYSNYRRFSTSFRIR
jgi:hypothetical protein